MPSSTSTRRYISRLGQGGQRLAPADLHSRRLVQTEQSTSVRVDVMLSVDMREETTCGGVCRQWALHELIEGIGDGASGDLTQQGSPVAPQQFWHTAHS